MIINKPPYIATLADRAQDTNILDLARAYIDDPKVCHRLDKETSGILVIAKNLSFYKYFSKLLELREVSKLYHTVVEGRHEFSELEVDKPILVTSNRSRVDIRSGKPSVTLISTIEIFKSHTLLACMPFTGRTHQIRVHLSDLNIPIIGDHFYGGNDLYLSNIKRNYHLGRDKEELPLIQRMALHAAKLSFLLENGEIMQIDAPYPKDFSVLIRQLEKNTS